MLGDTKITPIPVEHGSVETIGYRFDDAGSSIAYLPDAKSLKLGSAALLENLDHLIIDCLREKPHPTHMSLAESLETISAVKPKHAWLTHIGHEMDITKVESTLPANVNFAYDTLTLPE